jgi:hypothetical protein
MKKLILIASVYLFSCAAMASGKMSLQLNGYDKGNRPRPQAGLVIYEKLLENVYVNTFVGIGEQPLEVKDDVQWFVAKLALETQVSKKWNFAVGYSYKNLLDGATTDHIPFIKATYILW